MVEAYWKHKPVPDELGAPGFCLYLWDEVYLLLGFFICLQKTCHPTNGQSRRPQVWLRDSAWICCCPHVSPQPFVLGANVTLETWILWLLHGSNILEVGRTKPLNAQGYSLNQSKLLITETLSYRYLRISPEVPESAWEQPIFLSNKECFRNALYSRFSTCGLEASWIFNYIHKQANVHKGECLIHFFKFL